MEKKSKKKVTAIISLLIIIILIIVGVVVIKKIKTSKSKNKENTAEYTEKSSEDATDLIDMNNTDNSEIEEGVKKNTSKEISKDRNLDGMLITDIKLNAQDGLSHLTATVKNNTSKKFDGGVAKITFKNQDGSLYAELEVYIPEINAGENNAIDASTISDITNAYDFSIELEK